MRRTVRIQSAPNRIPVRTIVARELGISASDADALLDQLPMSFPRYYSEDEADEVAEKLRSKGADASAYEVTHPATTPCRAHPKLVNDGTCDRCGSWICSVCRARAGGDRQCPTCHARDRRKSRWKQRRVAVLLVILAAVALYAFQVTQRRAARTDWDRTLRVGLIIVEQEPVDPALIDDLEGRIGALESMLADQAERHDAPATPPFQFSILGPTSLSETVPSLPVGANFIDRLKYKFALDKYLGPVDDQLNYAGLDARVYLLVQPPAADEDPRFVEGLAELGGERGLVEVDLASDTVDLALIAAAHELFHLLGATDKYGPGGSVLIPDGLAEPDRSPRFPQTRAEIMARLIAISPVSAVLPTTFGAVVVGETTAREIGWVRNE